MKRYIPFIYSVSALVVSASLFACNNQPQSPINSNNNPQPATPASCPATAVMVTIPENSSGQGVSAFGTSPLVVPVGGSIQWMNKDSIPHTATSDTGTWDTDTIAPGETSAPLQFATVGTFPYHCEYTGKESMSGVVQVVPLPEGCPAPAAVPVTPSGPVGGGVTAPVAPGAPGATETPPAGGEATVPAPGTNL